MPLEVVIILMCWCFQLFVIRVAGHCVQGQSNVTLCLETLPAFRKNVSLQMLIIRECAFDAISNVTFANVVQLSELKIICDRHVTFQNGWTSLLSNSNVKFIDLSNNFIFQLPPGTFCELKSLTEVRLGSNSIEQPETLGFGSDGSNECAANLPIERLMLSKNKIRTIVDDTFFQLRQLVELCLSENVIELIEPFAFRGLKNLDFLNLSGNKLSKISSHVFLPIVQLSTLAATLNHLDDQIFEAIALFNISYLFLGHNNIANLNVSVFHNLNSLVLNNNRIKSIPPFCFVNTTQLEVLDLQSNNLSTINSHDFLGLNKLIILQLSNNYINAISNYVFDGLTQLKMLSVDRNLLKNIPNISNLQLLSIFNISSNQIDRLGDEDFANNEQLRKLDVSNNNLKFLSQRSLRNLKVLQEIYLSENFIENIESDALNISKDLRVVRLDKNRLTSVKGVFHQYSQVKKLNLSSNRFKSIFWTDFPLLIDEIQLDNNAIEKIESSGDPPQNRLATIDLHNNRLSALNPAEIPQSFVSLRLDNNSIRRIENLALTNNGNWRYLNLQNNELQQLCKSLLPSFYLSIYDLPLVFLSGNPFQCSCEMEWIVPGNKHSIQLQISDLDKVSCKGEDPLLGKNVTSSVIDNFKNGRFWCKSGFNSSNVDENTCKCLENAGRCSLPCPRNCTCYHDGDWSNVVMRCFQTGLVKVPVNGSKRTLKILISDNFIPIIKQTDFDSYANLTQLLFTRNRLRFIDDNSFLGLPNLQKLALSNNKLRKLSNKTFVGLTKLAYLYLNGNQLKEIANETFHPLINLKEIQLNDNYLVKFPVWSLNVPQATVGSNLWSCECEFVNNFRKWLTKSVVLDSDNVTCLMDKTIVSMVTINDTVCLEIDEQIKLSTMTVLISSVLVVFIPSIIIAFIVFYFRKEIQVLVYARYGIRLGRRGVALTDKVYDVFVSYSSLDDQFLVDHILPGLETEVEAPYRLCLHQRDFAAGAFISDAILAAVERSKATLFLLSHNFLESEWCRFEFKAAHLHMLRDPNFKVIVVLLQSNLPQHLDPEIRLYLKTNTYIVWGDKLFWKRLYFALPKPSGYQNDDQAEHYI